MSSSAVMAGETLEYRAIYSGALFAVLLGVISASLWLTADSLASCLALVPIPLVGMVVSLRSWLKVRSEPEIYTGSRLALAGLLLSGWFLFTGVGYAGYVYATEVPEGYARISFLTLKPNQTEEESGQLIPTAIQKLVAQGQPVFIKGYIRPDSCRTRTKIDQFLLVRDDNQCCFGDLAKVQYFDQIAVKLTGLLRTDYRTGLFRVGGMLKLQPQSLSDGATLVYALEADHIE